jgi:hypothetical protein
MCSEIDDLVAVARQMRAYLLFQIKACVIRAQCNSHW